ncbi:hypothetical protein AVEN_120374-1 [Araneus ventricosus]|uniref:Uncharacterized protein n=1 Tax=Araneus ventricosus TaxID=182803 RepID=A0A4Y2Q8E8_ARAVE|nr:hypothetical protein AVEN_120374-1 [Araneus ventricosus]
MKAGYASLHHHPTMTLTVARWTRDAQLHAAMIHQKRLVRQFKFTKKRFVIPFGSSVGKKYFTCADVRQTSSQTFLGRTVTGIGHSSRAEGETVCTDAQHIFLSKDFVAD